MNWTLYIVITATLTALLVGMYHFAFYRRYGDGWPGKMRTGDPTYWPLIIGFSLAFAMAIAELILDWPARVTPWMIVGWALLLFGNAWNRWAYRTLGEHYRPTAHKPEGPVVRVNKAPYKWMRHPLYAGQTVYLIGLMLGVDADVSWLGLAFFLPPLARRVWYEDALLKIRG